MLKNKEYHGLCEALFHAALADKQVLLTGKSGVKTANTRLDLCARALRDTIANGVTKLRGNTVKAVIDHIIDTLPDPDGSFFEPLARNYIQTLETLLANPVHVENLALLDGEGWLKCVDFFIAEISRLFEGVDSSLAGLGFVGRESPVPGTAHSSIIPSNGRLRNLSQRGTGHPQQNDLLPLIQCLLSLMSAPNAPYMIRRQEISDSVLRVLRLRLNFGKLHRLAFATLNCLILQTAGDDPTLGRTLTVELLPLLSYWWQPRTLDNDELLFSVRDEMLKTIHSIHLYLDSLLHEASSATLLSNVEDLLDNLWSEYSQRSHHSRLRLDDLLFSSITLPPSHFSTSSFTLRPFNQDAERRWALVETIAQLEDIFIRHTRDNSQRPGSGDEQPRKKQRIAGGSHRIHQKMLSSDSAVTLTALQLIPFFLPRNSASGDDISIIVDDLIPIISDKQGLVSSWAMIASAM